MANCNGCLKENIDGFCSACETRLFDRSKVHTQVGFNWEDIRDTDHITAFSLAGVHPKALIGRTKNNLLVPSSETDSEPMYIIKPQLSTRRALYFDSPANEHLTMNMADQLFKISTAKCALIKFENGDSAYLSKRFDKDKNGNALRQEDFASALNATPGVKDHGLYKYNSFTYEDVGNRLNPTDQIRFIRMLIYNFLTGNGDVHLKNLSILESSDGDMLLAPAYDLMNTKLHINDHQIAMNLFKEMERTKKDFLTTIYSYQIKHFLELGKRIGIRERLLDSIEEEFRSAKNDMLSFIDKSFLSDAGKQRYKEVVELHHGQLFNS